MTLALGYACIFTHAHRSIDLYWLSSSFHLVKWVKLKLPCKGARCNKQHQMNEIKSLISNACKMQMQVETTKSAATRTTKHNKQFRQWSISKCTAGIRKVAAATAFKISYLTKLSWASSSRKADKSVQWLQLCAILKQKLKEREKMKKQQKTNMDC